MGRPPERDIVAEVRAGKIAPVYYLYGKERFLLQRAFKAIREAVLEPRTAAFNYDVVDCKEGSGPVEKVLSAARTLPMMARHRLVVARDADAIKPDDLAVFLPYVSDPAETTCLVFVAENADLRRRFFLELKRRGGVIKFDPLYERQLPGWVEAEVRNQGHTLERAAARLLVDIIGADLAQLASAIEQLALYTGATKRITVAHVEEVVAETRQHSVFDLANAVGDQDLRRALHRCRRMLQAREPAPRILFMLTRHFRQLWMVRELMERRASRDEIAGAVGIRPFFVEGLCAQARHFDPEALAGAFRALAAADRALKSSRLGDELVLERLLMRLSQSPGEELGS